MARLVRLEVLVETAEAVMLTMVTLMGPVVLVVITQAAVAVAQLVQVQATTIQALVVLAL